jgi:hypothetical protein
MKLLWENIGKPNHTYKRHFLESNCACCGIDIDVGVLVKDVIGTAAGRYGEYMPFGTYVCEACAWMCCFPLISHRSFIAFANKAYWPMISHKTISDERPSWYEVFKEIVDMDVPCIGIMTTDTKPRLWPATKQCTTKNFGIYVHCLDYDISKFIYFNIRKCLDISYKISDILSLGFSKKAVLKSVLNDIKKFSKRNLAIEQELKILRTLPEFIPALLITERK